MGVHLCARTHIKAEIHLLIKLKKILLLSALLSLELCPLAPLKFFPLFGMKTQFY
jgi:hypothetical protein